MEAGTLTVRHTLTRRTHELGEPKTERGRRTLRLPSTALVAIRAHRVAQAEARLAAGRRWQDRGLVFTTGHGTALDSRNVTRMLQAALAKAGLPRQRFHDLRHAYATLMLEAGEDLAVVSRSLGHAGLAITADVYGHWTPAMKERSAERMEGILAG
jgi:integrase